MSRIFRSVAALGTIALTAACASPSSPTTTTVAGYVIAFDAVPAAGATVTGSIAGVTHTTTADSTGRFILGTYPASEGQSVQIRASLDGYPEATTDAIVRFPQTSVGVTLSPDTSVAPSVALSIDSFSLGGVGASGNMLAYFPDLVLHETTGTGPATIADIVFTASADSSAAPLSRVPPCLRTHLVPAGHTWRLLDSANSDYYCQEIDTSDELKALYVTIHFTDSLGHLGTVTGTTNK